MHLVNLIFIERQDPCLDAGRPVGIIVAIGRLIQYLLHSQATPLSNLVQSVPKLAFHSDACAPGANFYATAYLDFVRR